MLNSDGDFSVQVPNMALRKSNVRLIVLGLFYILYLIIGASIFSAIEGPQEKGLVKELKEQRDDFLKAHQTTGLKGNELI